MIASKTYSVATTLYLVSLLFSAVLVVSAKIECTKSASSEESNINKEEFIVLLEPKKGTENTAILKQHLDFFKDCLGMDSQPFLDQSNGKITTKKLSPNTVLHFSVSTLFGFFGSFNPQLVEQQIKLFPNIKSVEKVSKVKAIAPIQNNGGSTTVSTSFYDLDRIDQRGIKLDGKYTFPTPAGKGVNVYVIDTGINPNVAEFDDRVRFGGSFCTECSEVDDNGHGSAVASVIGGKNFGVAKKVNLIA
ncbi:4762_t:CDS:1, partial [Entrophospora sp. SA101]